MALGMLQDDDEASGITQEAFVAAWRGLPALRGEARFATWLYRIAYQCCVRQLERRTQERARHSAMQAEQMLEGVNNEKQAVDTREGHDQQAIVRETLDTLPTMYRMVLILRHLQDLTYEEMADILTMPIGTIKTQLFRARNLLKERLLAQHHQCLDSSS
jgi:RNA polymerase sigma-70 factor (ECF subfamily)